MTFLCLRRGVSRRPDARGGDIPFSLPTQRCFLLLRHRGNLVQLFSAYAEVFLFDLDLAEGEQPFLCLRRGVSIESPGLGFSLGFSLPTQRCFCVM